MGAIERIKRAFGVEKINAECMSFEKGAQLITLKTLLFIHLKFVVLSRALLALI